MSLSTKFLILDACATQEVYTGEDNFKQPHIEDTQTCFVTLNEVLKCVISLERPWRKPLTCRKSLTNFIT
jgi:hypothetical protein